jgi:hypothetical protein
MSAMVIAWIVFACVLGGALLGMSLRPLLPEKHLSGDTKDVVKVAIALIATMAALVLSLLISSAKSAYDTRSSELVQMSADLVLLDRMLAYYGPETKDTRSFLHAALAAAIERYWPANGVRVAKFGSTESPFETIYNQIEQLSPQTDYQRSLKAQALKATMNLEHTRFLLFEGLGNSIPLPFLVVMGVLVDYNIFQLWLVRSGKSNSIHGLCSLRDVGCWSTLSYPGTRPIIRRDDAGFERAATPSPRAANKQIDSSTEAVRRPQLPLPHHACVNQRMAKRADRDVQPCGLEREGDAHSGTVVPITLSVHGVRPEPAQPRRGNRRGCGGGDECSERNAGNNGAVIGCAHPWPVNPATDSNAAIGTPHNGPAVGSSNGDAAIGTAYCTSAQRTAIHGASARSAHGTPAKGVRRHRQRKKSGETKTDASAHGLTPGTATAVCGDRSWRTTPSCG